ncbi:MAG TPA: SDR family oxidoreductase, partial [Nocardioides sp.]|nr:SDR family oxidoreductase [Nocardioides sp.]
MTGLLEGRVAIVTGAGRGIGRAHALELAAHGAAVVVNDYGVSLAGEKDDNASEGGPADEVVAAIEAAGGRAVANRADVADFEQAAAMVQQAIDTFGGLDVLVNNAGFVRDRMLVNTSEEEWDAVIRVHLKGHFAPLRHAGAYWRTEAKEGRPRAARVVNTSSGAGLQGSVGQATYSAAKAGIAGLTLVAAQELGRYGVTVNAIAPVARTRMTEGAFDTADMALPEDNSPLVAWLASEDAGDVTGRVFEIDGSAITVENGWSHGPSRDHGTR